MELVFSFWHIPTCICRAWSLCLVYKIQSYVYSTLQWCGAFTLAVEFCIHPTVPGTAPGSLTQAGAWQPWHKTSIYTYSHFYLFQGCCKWFCLAQGAVHVLQGVGAIPITLTCWCYHSSHQIPSSSSSLPFLQPLSDQLWVCMSTVCYGEHCHLWMVPERARSLCF